MSFGRTPGAGRFRAGGRRPQMARPIAPAHGRLDRARVRSLAVAATLTALVLVGVVGAMGFLAGGSPQISPTPQVAAATTSVPASPSPTARVAGAGAGGRPTAYPTQRATPPPTRSPRASPTVAATPARDPNAAPASAADFDLEAQVIDIVFPLRPETRYHYRDNFRDPREGEPQVYNHARPRADGKLVRLHDGIDIYARAGEPVVAPFSGVVTEARDLWPPWEKDRYGVTVVVVSEEPASSGYAAVMVHLDRAWVDIGQHVERGQVVGVLGATGNAEAVPPQLHFELRAPFDIDWSALGEERRVDAFNPFPSLERADPQH